MSLRSEMARASSHVIGSVCQLMHFQLKFRSSFQPETEIGFDRISVKTVCFPTSNLNYCIELLTLRFYFPFYKILQEQRDPT